MFRPDPGDDIFDGLSYASLLTYPTTNLPFQGPNDHGEPLVFSVDAEAWQLRRVMTEEERRLSGMGGQPGFWTVQVDGMEKDLAGFPSIWHQGQMVPMRHQDDWPGAIQADILWFDRRKEVLFWWDETETALHAISGASPGNVTLQFDPLSGPQVARYEQGTDGVPALNNLVMRGDFNGVDRRCLLLPSGAQFSLPVSLQATDSLRVSAGLPQLMLLGGGDRGDGAVFAVDVVSDGATTRAWETHVKPGEGWFDANIDLSSWTGREVTIQLVTESGPAENKTFDYGLWASLQFEGRPRTLPSRPHVILLDLDTLRADRLGVYGYSRPTSPCLDSFARREGTVYLDAISNASWTLPATTSMLTGLAVHQHQVDRFPRKMTTDLEPLALQLSRAGYDTYGMCEGGYVMPAFGFSIGFDQYDHRARQIPQWDRALEWLDERRSENPFFLFLQTYMTHAPYAAPPEGLHEPSHYAGRLEGQVVDWSRVIGPFEAGTLRLNEADQHYIRRAYDGGVRDLDALLCDMLVEIKKRVSLDEVLLIITSDHGEELFEHGGLDHGKHLHGEVLKVPLIVRFPGQQEPRIVEAPVTTLDLVPTVLDVVGLPVPPHLPGRSLRHSLSPFRARVAEHKNGDRSIQFDGYKLIQSDAQDGEGDGSFLLFDLEADPGELIDLAAKNPTKRRALLNRMREFIQKYPEQSHVAISPTDLTDETMTTLNELGYLRDG